LFKAAIGINFSPSVKTVLPSLTIPMLLIWGQKDRFVPPALANRFAQYNQKLEVLNLADVGHCPHDECPEQVNQAIVDWIERWVSVGVARRKHRQPPYTSPALPEIV
jgi:pimeloyl-ACP methyl ester carboxylesterase